MIYPISIILIMKRILALLASGKTIEEAFEQAARAVFAYMADLSKVSARETDSH